jgi:prolyl-tRNA synthetase
MYKRTAYMLSTTRNVLANAIHHELYESVYLQVIRPWGMAIWDAFRTDLDTRIKANGVDNAYFPLFIPRSFLSKEVQHSI